MLKNNKTFFKITFSFFITFLPPFMALEGSPFSKADLTEARRTLTAVRDLGPAIAEQGTDLLSILSSQLDRRFPKDLSDIEEEGEGAAAPVLQRSWAPKKPVPSRGKVAAKAPVFVKLPPALDSADEISLKPVLKSWSDYLERATLELLSEVKKYGGVVDHLAAMSLAGEDSIKKKQVLLVDIRRHALRYDSLSAQFLSPPKRLKPRFVMQKVAEGYVRMKSFQMLVDEEAFSGTDLPQSMSMIFNEEAAFRADLGPVERAPFMPKVMDLDYTYVLDEASGKYIKAGEQTVLPEVFMTYDRKVNRGRLYNAYHSNIGIVGSGAGYVFVDENGETSRRYNALKVVRTIFSSTKSAAAE